MRWPLLAQAVTPAVQVSSERAWEVLHQAPARAHHVPQHVLHGNVRVLVGWGPRVGKTARLIELAAERALCARIAVVCRPERADWIHTQLPGAVVLCPTDGQLQVRQLEASRAEEIFVDDLERLHPTSSFDLNQVAARRQDVTVAVNAQHLPPAEDFWDAWFDASPPRRAPFVPDTLIRAAFELELIDGRAPRNGAERAWQAATTRRVLRERDARAPLAHLLPHLLVVLPREEEQAKRLLQHALAQTGHRVFAFLPPRPSLWPLHRPEEAALGAVCASLHVPLIAPHDPHLALRRAQVVLQSEHVLTVDDLPGATP